MRRSSSWRTWAGEGPSETIVGVGWVGSENVADVAGEECGEFERLLRGEGGDGRGWAAWCGVNYEDALGAEVEVDLQDAAGAVEHGVHGLSLQR